MYVQIGIDRGRTESLRQQISEAIRSQILNGDLRPGQKLPSVRDLSANLGVHRLTVLKAYEELSLAKLVECRQGSGTYVAVEFPRTTATSFLSRLTEIGSMNRFEAVSEEAGIRSLATNVPDPWLFRSDEFLFECYELRKATPWVFYYAPPGGAYDLCRVLAEDLTSQGLATEPAQIIITNGFSHSLALALSLVPGPVAIEDPTFLAANSWLAERGLPYVPVKRTLNHFDFDALVHAIRTKGCRSFILSPSFGQVTGWRMEDQDRERLVHLCSKHGCLIIEEFSSARLCLDGPAPMPLAALSSSANCILLDDFASALSPGLGVGYMRLSRDHAKQIETKLQRDQHSGVQFVQIALAKHIERGLFRAHLERSLPKYRERRDRLMSALTAHLPYGSSWSHPGGGFSTWVALPNGPDYSRLYERTLAKGLAIAPGNLFTDRSDRDRFVRLSYGTQDPPAIAEAVRILGEVLRTMH